MDEKSLGRRLQEARRAAGLTQQALCQKANLSYSTLAKIERGAIKTPSIFTIQSIASALGTSLDALVGAPTAAETPPRAQLRTKSGVRFIYFDINGSLVHFYQRAFAQVAKDTGQSADIVESTFWQFNDEACRGSMSLDDFNRAIGERLQTGTFDWKRYYLDAVEPIQPLQELLRWVSERYRVGLLSNTMPGLISAMRERELLPNINYDAIVDSSEVGTIKPEAHIYEIATERAGCSPQEIMLIDDTRPNLMAAQKAGWRAMLFDDYNAEESTAHLREALEPAE
jgi:FMN phosphatase YigB (HAD superfamily)/DNA-binding XRE family transcriptional regulator